MNRRHFFAVTLSALSGLTTSRALAQDKPIPKPSPRKVEIEVSLIKSALRPDNTNTYTHTIFIITDEDVETYAAFTQEDTFQIYDAKTKRHTSASQTFGPYLRVTPHIEPDGHMTVSAKVKFEEIVPGDLFMEPTPTISKLLTVTRTVESGQATVLGNVVIGKAQGRIQLIATILQTPQVISA